MRTIITLLLCASIAQAEPPKVTGPVKGEPGQFIVIRAETAGKRVEWHSIDKGLSLFPSELLTDPKATVGVALAPGQYRVLCWTSIADVPSKATLVVVNIGDGAPAPPQPPIPPTESDLTKMLKAAWASESDEAKAYGALPALRSIYSDLATAAQDPKYTLVKDLRDELVRRYKNDLLPVSLLKMRAVITAELNATLPRAADAPLDAANRAKCATAFSSIAAALGAIQ